MPPSPHDLHLLQVRDLDNRFYENLGIVATTALEKFNQEADVADTLPEEARLLLGDKDVFLNAIQVGPPFVSAGEVLAWTAAEKQLLRDKDIFQSVVL